jgi:nitroimidazol reductase NimA-like FMN-containing flavoprotein (pyridoxamine 5'-phosphate oxidase superfamily)
VHVAPDFLAKELNYRMNGKIREMRRKDRQMTPAEAEALLREADFGFLATVDDTGQPYCVPLNHVYVGGYIVFHCALEGAKLDNIRANPKVSYAVCTEHEVMPDKISTRYKSAIAFGTAEIVESSDLKKELLVALLERLAPGQGFRCGGETIANTTVVRIKVEVLTGKKRE